MKKLLWLLLAIFALVPMTAQATPPVDVQGDFLYFPTGCETEREANGNLFLSDCADTGDWYQGDFLGTSTEVYSIALHGFHGYDDMGFPLYDYAFYKGTVTFEGEVTVGDETRSGSFTLKMQGTSYESEIDNWSGTWRILGGMDGLAGLHGNGIHYSNGLGDVHYEGHAHFSP